MLTVTIYPDAADLKDPDGGTEFADVHYVSFVNNQTYGPPALIAPNPRESRDGRPTKRAALGEKVLFINTALVPAFEIIRTAD